MYEVLLKKGHKYLDNIAKDIVKQETMDYQYKIDLFIEALKENKKEKIKQELFQETIEIYSKKKGFSFLISLFIKVYQEKDLCKILIKNFYDMNVNIKGNEKCDGNSVRDPKFWEKFSSIMAKISSESDSLIKKNDYDPIQFYGIIICYLNFYDYSTLENYIDKLYKEKPEILYEILVVHFSHFLNPVKKEEKDKEFFINFFEYIISKKEFSFLNLGLRFVFDIDTFIIIIDKTRDEIYNKYIKDNKDNFQPIQIRDKLTLKKEKINDIIKGKRNINNFSDENKILLVYFKSDFWYGILKEFNKANPDYFLVYRNLRDIFIDYNNLIKSICDKEKDKDILKILKILEKLMNLLIY